MLRTIKRDGWKVLVLLLLGGCLDVLSMVVAKYFVLLLLMGALGYLIQQILPTCLHERKTFWNIGWKYIVWRLLVEMVILVVLINAGVSYALLKWPFFIIANTLFLGFLCAAGNNTGLWRGIKTLITKYTLRWLCALVVIKLALWVGAFLPAITFVNGMWITLVNVLVVYGCLPLFKSQAK